MSGGDTTPTQPSRRLVLGGALGALGIAAAGGGFAAGRATASGSTPAGDTVPLYGEHQAGITTEAQDRVAFAAFDVTTLDRDALMRMLGTWAAAAAQMTKGLPIGPIETAPQ